MDGISSTWRNCPRLGEATREDRGVNDPGRPDRDLYQNGALLPDPHAALAGPTFQVACRMSRGER